MADRTYDKGHGRLESRAVKVTGVAAGIGFRYARQAVQVTRRTRRGGSGRWRTETMYAVTDLDYDQISPAKLARARVTVTDGREPYPSTAARGVRAIPRGSRATRPPSPGSAP